MKKLFFCPVREEQDVKTTGHHLYLMTERLLPENLMRAKTSVFTRPKVNVPKRTKAPRVTPKKIL